LRKEGEAPPKSPKKSLGQQHTLLLVASHTKVF
jgi:hypothetical protein